MKVNIKLFVHHKVSGASTIAEIQGEIDPGTLTKHDLAGVLFACEFAINSHAGEMCGKPVRAHIFLDEEPTSEKLSNQKV